MCSFHVALCAGSQWAGRAGPGPAGPVWAGGAWTGRASRACPARQLAWLDMTHRRDGAGALLHVENLEESMLSKMTSRSAATMPLRAQMIAKGGKLWYFSFAQSRSVGVR